MTVVHIAAQIKQLLESVQQSACDPVLAQVLVDWPRDIQFRTQAAADLPVLRWLPEIADDTATFGTDVVAALCGAASSLAWRQSYTAKDFDDAFLDNYGWTEILGVNGLVASEHIACGFLLLGPSTHYPRHHHEAEEFYLPLSGAAAWQQGSGEWHERPPGTVIHHVSGESHAMRTGAAPLLALYIWRSANLAQKAQLD